MQISKKDRTFIFEDAYDGVIIGGANDNSKKKKQKFHGILRKKTGIRITWDNIIISICHAPNWTCMPEISCTLCCLPSTFPVLLWFRIDTYDAFRSTDFWKYADQMFEHSVVMIQNWYKPTMCSRQPYRRRGSKTYQTATLTTLNLQTRMRYILAFLPNENERRRKKHIRSYDVSLLRHQSGREQSGGHVPAAPWRRARKAKPKP